MLLAAGDGSRLGSSRPKAFVGLAGDVLLAHSLRAFEEHEAVDSIVLVVPDGWVGPTEVLVDDLGCDRVSSIEVGGATRAASVRAGLAAVPARDATAVLVHDAARPIVTAALVDRVLAPLADGFDGVVPVLEVADTIKRIDPATGVVVDTPARHELRAAQTPQACRASALVSALEGMDEQALALVTDCTQAIAQAGGRVTSVAGDPRAIKVTTAADHARVEALLGYVAPVLAAEEPEGAVGDDEEHPDDLVPLDEDDLAGADA